MQAHLARIGAPAIVAGALTLFVATLLHPMDADPDDDAAVLVWAVAAGIYMGCAKSRGMVRTD